MQLKIKKLSGFKTFFIGIHCPLETLEEREAVRGDRILGSARHQFYKLHEDIDYDLSIDTDSQKLDECVTKIIQLINGIM